MIISRTPFRMSFVGGGTDLPAFYMRESGSVISTTINKYVYITVNQRFDHTVRVSYSHTEIVNAASEVQHPLFRETMRAIGVDSGVEITSIADVPSGTGLGSSSSFTVGLFNALHAYTGRFQTAAQLAQQACCLEMEILKEPIGKQDQYAAAFGGLRRYVFNSDGTVFVDPVICPPETRARFYDHLMLFYLGGSRSASQILRQQSNQTSEKMDYLRRLRDLVGCFWDVLTQGRDLRQLGEMFHEGWECKKQLVQAISNTRIDEYYERARQAGALGGKLLGAGESGFLLLFCEDRTKDAVRQCLSDLREISFSYEPEGSKIIYVGG